MTTAVPTMPAETYLSATFGPSGSMLRNPPAEILALIDHRNSILTRLSQSLTWSRAAEATTLSRGSVRGQPASMLRRVDFDTEDNRPVSMVNFVEAPDNDDEFDW
jgi:hypothetical protein